MEYLLGPFAKLTALLAGEKPPASLDTPSQASLEACPPIATNAGARAASTRTKRIYPQLVVECIATYADSPSLVLLASCNRHLWRCIRGLQHYWKQRYMQEHTLEDDDELSWLRWYIKTLRASATDTSSNDGDIDWFRAYCHRHACDANWFKNDPKRVKDVEEVAAKDRNCDIILDRAYMTTSSEHHQVFEHCQPKAGSQRDRYWRGYSINSLDLGRNMPLRRCKLTSTHLIAVTKSETSHEMYIWPASRALNTKPRRLSYPNCTYQDARDCWLLFRTQETHRSNDVEKTTITIHVMDLETSRSSKQRIDGRVHHALLQRVTKDTATVLLTTYGRDDAHYTAHWSLWQFSPNQADSAGRCLMRGGPVILNSPVYTIIERLDDSRFIMRGDYIGRYKPEAHGYVANIAVISTRHDDGDPHIDNQRPVWSRQLRRRRVNIMVPQDRIIVLADDGWTVCRLSDGSILSLTSVDTMKPLLDKHCISRMVDLICEMTHYKNSCLLSPSKDEKSLVALDVVHPGRMKKMELGYLLAQHAATAERSSTNEAYDGYRIDPSKISVCSHHALCIRYGNEYKMLDLSI